MGQAFKGKHLAYQQEELDHSLGCAWASNHLACLGAVTQLEAAGAAGVVAAPRLPPLGLRTLEASCSGTRLRVLCVAGLQPTRGAGVLNGLPLLFCVLCGLALDCWSATRGRLLAPVVEASACCCLRRRASTAA